MNSDTRWTQLYDLMTNQVFVKIRPRPSKTLTSRLAADIWAVSLNLRPACLLDGLLIDQHIANQLSIGIKNIVGLNDNVLILYELYSNTTFVYSQSIFMMKNHVLDQWNTCKKSYINLSSSPISLMNEIPKGIKETNEIYERMQKDLIIITNQQQQCQQQVNKNNGNNNFIKVKLANSSDTLVSLAGLMLGYPCTYCRSHRDHIDVNVDVNVNVDVDDGLMGNGLQHVALKVIQIDLLMSPNNRPTTTTFPERHRLMTFSFPASLDTEQSPLHVPKLTSKIKHDILTKLNDLSSASITPYWNQVDVIVLDSLLDRVAL